MKLLLAPEKIISSTSESTWLKCGSSDMILFTAGDNKKYRDLMKAWNHKIFKHIECFKNYATNDLISLRTLEIADKYNITSIIPMSEADILRAANLREILGINGQDTKNAILFRDKIAMKDRATLHNIPTPKYKCIKDGTDIAKFIKEVGYPIVIKPILGRGSQSTFIIKNKKDLEIQLNSGFISNTCRRTDLLAEQYIESEIYHLDGLQINNKIRIMSVSKYINNCLSFVNGSFLGSYTLSDENKLKSKLLEFGYKLIKEAFPLPKNSLFHIELFVDRNENILLCEIASRLGGNGINDEVMLQHGIDIKMEFIKAECNITDTETIHTQKANIAARVLIPPKNGKLLSIPNICSLEGVLRYNSRGSIGKRYKTMRMSNDEIANFLLTGENEHDIHKKIDNITSWFYENTEWQTS